MTACPDQLRAGRMLYIDTSAELMTFNLQGTSRGSARFVRLCRSARTNGFPAATRSNRHRQTTLRPALSVNPFDPASASRMRDRDYAGDQAEANDVTVRLLQRAGITEYQIKDGLPDPLGFSTIWRNGKGVIGALLVMTEGGREDAEESLGAMMNGTRDDCAGKFVSNLDASAQDVRRLHAARLCRAAGDGGKSIMTYLSAFQRRQGGYYASSSPRQFPAGRPAWQPMELDGTPARCRLSVPIARDQRWAPPPNPPPEGRGLLSEVAIASEVRLPLLQGRAVGAWRHARRRGGGISQLNGYRMTRPPSTWRICPVM